MPLEPTTQAGADSYIVAAVLALLILLGFNATHLSRLGKQFFSDIWSIRQRDNVFEDHVATETPVLALMLIFTSVLEGVLVGGYLTETVGCRQLTAFLLSSSAAVVFNIFSVAACGTLGYTFTVPALALQWRRGLFASQSMLGMALILPAVVVTVCPADAIPALWIGAVCYVVARILYIIKGVRIFHKGYNSLIYFILYLCTLEIIPLLVLWRTLRDIASA